MDIHSRSLTAAGHLGRSDSHAGPNVVESQTMPIQSSGAQPDRPTFQPGLQYADYTIPLDQDWTPELAETMETQMQRIASPWKAVKKNVPRKGLD